jgi:hypothetical protein
LVADVAPAPQAVISRPSAMTRHTMKFVFMEIAP